MKVHRALLHLSSFTVTALVLFNCTKTVYIIEEPQVQSKNASPGTFEILVINITDQKVDIQWGNATDPEGESLTYEVALNDSVIAYDLNLNQYSVQGLQPEKEYKISVIALDRLRNASKIEKTVKTLKSFLKNAIQFDLHYEKYYFEKAIKTKDSGMLILGEGTIFEKTKPYRYFLLKLKNDYSIAWIKEYDWQPTDIEIPINLKEIPGEGYFVVHRQKITKVDEQGNIILSFKVPDTYQVFAFRDIESDMNGNYLVVGESNRNWPTPPVGIEYFLIKITGNGNEIWHKYGGNTMVNYPYGIMRIDKNRYMVVGTAESTGSVSYAEEHDWRTNLWILNVDGDGHEFSEHIFTNVYNANDVILSCLHGNDGSLILAGGTAGIINGAYNTVARITKIGIASNSIIWDSYPELGTVGVFCTIDCMDKIQDKEGYLLLASDDRGISFSECSVTGSLGHIVRIQGYPRGVVVKYNPLGYYEYISREGWLFVFNKEGYHD